MTWKKINQHVEMWDTPSLGSTDSRKEMYMALALDPKAKNPFQGIARKITHREGNEDVPGYVDKSQLVRVESEDGLHWKVTKALNIKGEQAMLGKLASDEHEFIGLEDPDIVVDEEGTYHVYFSIAFHRLNPTPTRTFDVYLGHAKGPTLDQLHMCKPVLQYIDEDFLWFKELAMVPGRHMVLTEAGLHKDNKAYNGIALAYVDNLDDPWKHEKIILDPHNIDTDWCKLAISPVNIFAQIKHKGKFVGIVNGREASVIVNGETQYKKFRPGLILFDQENESIPWIADQPLFEDPEATTITFLSDTRVEGEYVYMYAHVNDAFVRTYRIKIEDIKKLLPADA